METEIIEHTLREIDVDLKKIDEKILGMWDQTITQWNDLQEVLTTENAPLVEKMGIGEDAVDRAEEDIELAVARFIALRQPAAIDLRRIIAVLRISIELERIADYAAGAARRALRVNHAGFLLKVEALPRMGWAVKRMLEDVKSAYVSRDPHMAMATAARDHEVNALQEAVFHSLGETPSQGETGMTAVREVLYIAKSLERAGDHIENIAEHLHFMVQGALYTSPKVQAAPCPV